MLSHATQSQRIASPANSEISVGSPSPPPQANLPLYITQNALNMASNSLKPPIAVSQRKSSGERVKSFSIADILGSKIEEEEKNVKQQNPTPATISALKALPTINPHALAQSQILHEQLLHPGVGDTLVDPLTARIANKIAPTWEQLRVAPFALHPLFPQSLLQYEQRIAWDYQRQLQEHFQAQALLLREMSMDPTIIPSEDSSERSHSSSTGSNYRHSPATSIAKSITITENELKSNRSDMDDDDDDDNDDEPDVDVDKPADQSKKTDANAKPSTDTPLDALFQLSTKNFDEEQDPATLSIFATRPNAKKKRKSRTAFTNHQIFELEKRFLYQKYLSPADRDEIAGSLGLSNAQVITWFQNRRAKLKRDMEELKKDVESVKQLHDQPADSNKRSSTTSQQLYTLYQQTATHLMVQQQKQQQSQHQLHHPHQNGSLSTYATTKHQDQPHHHQQLGANISMAYQLPMNQVKRAASTPHTAAEDKNDIKMLKMLTLMYYSNSTATATTTTTSTCTLPTTATTIPTATLLT